MCLNPRWVAAIVVDQLHDLTIVDPPAAVQGGGGKARDDTATSAPEPTGLRANLRINVNVSHDIDVRKQSSALRGQLRFRQRSRGDGLASDERLRHHRSLAREIPFAASLIHSLRLLYSEKFSAKVTGTPRPGELSCDAALLAGALLSTPTAWADDSPDPLNALMMGGTGAPTPSIEWQDAMATQEATYPGDPFVVEGYSQSASIAVLEKEDLAAVGQHPDVTFLLLGNPNQPDGGLVERFVGLDIPSVVTIWS
jgi:hypothetical protein